MRALPISWRENIMPNPFDPGYYTEHDLKDAGFKRLGRNLRIDKNCTIIGLENIELGDNVRIDSYCTIVAAGNGWLKLGSYIHIGGYCLLSAGSGIHMEDFSGLSHGVKVYSRSDDYTGKYMTNPTVPEKYTGVHQGPVILGRHVIIGCGSVILPNLTIGEGSSVGALSLVSKSLDPWGIYVGCPADKVKDRSNRLLELEAELKRDTAGQ
jgi:acetyltransferase-like isoleucine patch superfamily enzyme